MKSENLGRKVIEDVRNFLARKVCKNVAELRDILPTICDNM